MAEQLLREMADASKGLEQFHVLVDIRDTSGGLEPVELWRLSQHAASYRRTFGDRTAVLCPMERFDKARFFALCAEERGLNVHAFTSYEDAMEWLLAGQGQ